MHLASQSTRSDFPEAGDVTPGLPIIAFTAQGKQPCAKSRDLTNGELLEFPGNPLSTVTIIDHALSAADIPDTFYSESDEAAPQRHVKFCKHK